MSDGANEITLGLMDWAKATLPGAKVAARGSGDPAGEGSVEIRLLAMSPRPAPRTATPPAVLALDYLIAVRQADPLEEHRLAAELMFAALDREDFEIVTDRSPAEAATALGLPPAAGLVVRIYLSRARVRPRAPIVRFPLQTEITGVGRVEGQVLGPDDIPVSGAVVTLAGLNRSVRTGPDGRFRIAGPLPDTAAVRLTARAKGVEAQATAKPGEPAVLHLPLET